jgi:hypothetical protein
MNSFRMARGAAALAVLLASWHCGSTTPTTPSTPATPGVQKIETYADTFHPGANEIFAYHFPVTASGALDVAITSLAPVSTITMGLRVSAWDFTLAACPAQLVTACSICENPAARLNGVIEVTPQQAGEYCVAVYDTGNVQQNTDFTLTVTHF